MKKGNEWVPLIHQKALTIARRLQDEDQRDAAISFLDTCGLLEAVAIGHFMTTQVDLEQIARRLSEVGCASQVTPTEAVRLLQEEINAKA